MYDHYVVLAKLVGYECAIVRLATESVEAVRLCVRRNVHSVPLEIVARMAVEMEPDDREKVVPVHFGGETGSRNERRNG